MAKNSSIEWTEVTWNPVTGCSKISAGCKFCYAERMAKRLQAIGIEQYRDGFALRLAPQVLSQPYTWKRPRTVFVNSMSDLFHEKVPTPYIQQVFEVMNETPRHVYQILTKRSERLSQIATSLVWTANIWMGVSVEEEKVNSRIINLTSTPARVKFVSCEPLIAPVGHLPLTGIDWLIVGGESGPGARMLHKSWVDDIYLQCRRRGIRFFFKQWGRKEFNVDAKDPTIDSSHPLHAKGGCQLDGRVLREMPQAAAL